MTTEDFNKQNPSLAAKSMEIALSKVGTREATGHNDGPFVKAVLWFSAKLGIGSPWCAAFATWCIYQASDQVNQTPILAKSASSTSIYSQAKKLHLLLSGPIPNCIGLLRGSGGTPWKTHHHTFRVISVDHTAGTVKSVDGNWGNAVTVTHHPIAGCDFVAVA